MAATTAIRTMNLSDVPTMRRTCEITEEHYGEPTPLVAAFIISLTSRNAALRGGLYVCAEHATANAKFVVSRVVVQQCDGCLAFDGGHEDHCTSREWTVPPSPAWSRADEQRIRQRRAI